jgi:predicted ATPase
MDFIIEMFVILFKQIYTNIFSEINSTTSEKALYDLVVSEKNKNQQFLFLAALINLKSNQIFKLIVSILSLIYNLLNLKTNKTVKKWINDSIYNELVLVINNIKFIYNES